MTIVVVGANGQLGRCLQDRLLSFNNSSSGAFVKRPLHDKEILALSSSDLDICDQASVKSYFEKVSPSVVINAAAYTAVDRAEEEQERAHSVNCEGVENLADACAQNGAALIHVSTDYVFSGEADTPYKPEDATAPLGVYGHSKLRGEVAAARKLKRLVILRTAWVYSEYGQNFLKTMLRLMESRDEVSVVDDQVGSPTYAGNIADAIICIAERVLEGKQCWGTYHYVDADVMSWHKFSELIFQQAMSLGVIEKKMKVNAIPSSAYPTPTKRPSYSVLDTSSLVREFSFNQVNCLSSLDTVLKALSSGKAID